MAAACAIPAAVSKDEADASSDLANLGESTVVVMTTQTDGETNDTVQIQTMTLDTESSEVIQVIPLQDEHGQEVIIQMQQSDVNQGTGSDIIQVIPVTEASQFFGENGQICIQEATHVLKKESNDLIDKKQIKTEIDTSKAVIEEDNPIRRSGRLPSRRRTIPSKFRDYRNPDTVSDDNVNESDSSPDFVYPHSEHKRVLPYSPKGKRGRPRKYPHLYELHTKVIPTAVEVMEVDPVTNQTVVTASEVTPTSHGGQAEIQGEITSETEVKTAESTEQMVTSSSSLQGPEGGRGDGQTDSPQEPQVDKVNATTQSIISPRIRSSKFEETKCPTCHKVFSSKGNMKTHMLIHAGMKPFSCDFPNCTKYFRSNETLRRHKLAHMGIKSFQCTFCSNKFASSVSLQEHMCRHTDARPHQCNVCLKNFRQISCLRRHMVTHSTELPFTCEICFKKFSTNIYLKSHMKSHTGEKPFKCPECDKRFAHQSDVTRHKIIHTGERPYECEVCHAKFSDPSSKRRHEREHVGVKPYTCQLCNDSFKRSGQLKAHLSRKHTNEKDDVSVVYADGGELQFMLKDGTNLVPDLTKHENTVNTPSMSKQKKIVKLIKDLNSSMVQHVQINLPSHDYNNGEGQTESTIQSTEEQLAAVETVIMKQRLDNSVQENVILDQVTGDLQHIVTDHDEEVQTGEDKEESHIIAIAEVTDMLQNTNDRAEVPVEYLQIIEELAPDSLEQQIVEVHYQHSEEPPQGSENSVSSANNQQKMDNLVTSPSVMEGLSPPSQQMSQQNSAVTQDYVTNPDFGSQQYYNWLSSFTELCKVVPMPLDVSLFQKISQVHKTLSDVMATPSGVVADKENFKILMNISKELNAISNEHLFYVMQNLEKE